MPHLDEGTIHAWLDGALGDADAAALEAHLAECATCREAVAEARGFVAAASRILGALDDVPGNVRPGTTTAPAPARRPRAWWRRAPVRAAAAVLLVAGGATLVVREAGVPGGAEAPIAAVQASRAPAPIADDAAAGAATAEPYAAPQAPRGEESPAPAPAAVREERDRGDERRARAARPLPAVVAPAPERATAPQAAPLQEKVADAPPPAPAPETILRGKVAGVPGVTLRAPSAKAADAAAAREAAPLAQRSGFTTAPARTGAVRGVVRDADGRPLAGAEVRATDEGRVAAAVTDSAGRFVLDALPAGARELAVRRIGYRPTRVPVEVRADTSVAVAVELRQESVALSSVVVAGGAAQPDAPIAGCWRPADDLDALLRLDEGDDEAREGTLLPAGTAVRWRLLDTDSVLVTWRDSTGRVELRVTAPDASDELAGNRVVRTEGATLTTPVRLQRAICPVEP